MRTIEAICHREKCGIMALYILIMMELTLYVNFTMNMDFVKQSGIHNLI